jgi:tRNA1Val (adenine37-N6)-methyltransferase
MFTFQQFKIYQEYAAMKVGTDGVLLGAWTPLPEKADRILDIGTGTGLVALMVAQRSSAGIIDAVEIDAPGCVDAERNFENSPWSERLILYNKSFQVFAEKAAFKYDLIVSNPPFFSASLKNPCHRKATARHDGALSKEDLVEGVLRLLSEDGVFSLILPVVDYEEFRSKASRAGLYESRRLMVKPTPYKPVKRVISVWGKLFPEDPVTEEIVLELSRHQYSNFYKTLTADFYLQQK